MLQGPPGEHSSSLPTAYYHCRPCSRVKKVARAPLKTAYWLLQTWGADKQSLESPAASPYFPMSHLENILDTPYWTILICQEMNKQKGGVILFSTLRSLKAAYNHIPFPSPQQALCVVGGAEMVLRQLRLARRPFNRRRKRVKVNPALQIKESTFKSPN